MERSSGRSCKPTANFAHEKPWRKEMWKTYENWEKAYTKRLIPLRKVKSDDFVAGFPYVQAQLLQVEPL